MMPFAPVRLRRSGICGGVITPSWSCPQARASRSSTSSPRCSCPAQGVDNLLLAGRDISGIHLAHSNYRVMPICAQMGQAVGIAAALDVCALQVVLRAQGVEP